MLQPHYVHMIHAIAIPISMAMTEAFPVTVTATAAFRPSLYRRYHRHRITHPSHPFFNRPRPRAALSSSPDHIHTVTETETSRHDDKFDWYAQWYPVMPICDLDKRRPHGKKVLGIDLVVWWDRNESAWKVMGDVCPHRLAPLSDGRIDHLGRLQCVYHGWCFDGSGNCKLIPQAPRDGPPVHTFKQACVAAVYPTTVQHDIVWFWPNSDPEYKDIITKKKPMFIEELEDPSLVVHLGNRDIPYGYEILIENLMDPAHAPYAHYGIRGSEKVDREGGMQLEISIDKLDKNGFVSRLEQGTCWFLSPCVFYMDVNPFVDFGYRTTSTDTKNAPASPSALNRKIALVFICVPVGPGKSRLIWIFPRNYDVDWIERFLPRWIFHLSINLIVDSDMYLLHAEERKILEVGPLNWQKECFVPTKCDALVTAFRRWLNKYAGGQVDWKGKFGAATLPPTPPREQLMDRYWTHVVNCSSCNAAYKALNVLELALQIGSIALLGIFAATKHGASSTIRRNGVIVMAVVCFAASRWLANFTYKQFRYHDYDHAFR